MVVRERTLTLDSTKKDRREKKELSREERSERSTWLNITVLMHVTQLMYLCTCVTQLMYLCTWH